LILLFAVEYGTPIISPVDGWAMCSYQSYYVEDNAGNQLFLDNKPYKLGGGIFFQIVTTINGVDRVIQGFHMSKADPSIPWFPPTYDPDKSRWNPTNHNLPFDAYKSGQYAARVKVGQILGYVGYSGFAWGYEEFQGDPKPEVEIDPQVYKTWDPAGAHLHLEEGMRFIDEKTGKTIKATPRDVLGVYGVAAQCPSPSNKGVSMTKPLVFVDQNGLPLFAA